MTTIKRIAVIGSRTFSDYELMKKVLDEYEPFVLVSGGAKGTDNLAERYADEKGYRKIIYSPDKAKHGRGAYHRRNELIVGDADELIAFWDGKSKGTAFTVNQARKKGIPVRIVEFEQKK